MQTAAPPLTLTIMLQPVTPAISAEVSESLSDRRGVVVVVRTNCGDETALIHFSRSVDKRGRATAFARDITGPIGQLRTCLQRIERAAQDHGADSGMTFGFATMIADVSEIGFAASMGPRAECTCNRAFRPQPPCPVHRADRADRPVQPHTCSQNCACHQLGPGRSGGLAAAAALSDARRRDGLDTPTSCMCHPGRPMPGCRNPVASPQRFEPLRHSDNGDVG